MTSLKNPITGDIKSLSFSWYWMFTPICAVDLLLKGKIIQRLLGWIPLFTLIWMFQDIKILGDALKKQLSVEVN